MLLEALDLLEDEGFEGVVAVVDADFDRLRGTTYRLKNFVQQTSTILI